MAKTGILYLTLYLIFAKSCISAGKIFEAMLPWKTQYMTFAIANIFSTFDAAIFCTFQTVYILKISNINNST